MRIGRTGLVVLTGIFVAGAAWAQEGATGVVKERMDAMSDIGDQMKIIGKMMKSGPYDTATLATASGNIAGHAGPALLKLFPEGSIQETSDAKQEIWTDWPKFQALAGDLEASAQALKDLAEDGAGKELTSAAFGTLAGTCKSCHETFRVKK
ncbi:c-type cytochrome [Roseibium sp. Sym1]|uniref:c-type cytochrome n=1 Tax=Roseibium sp. Sym1 TaxID=3016006 RepID=UPI0022B57050|nr:cytochrome c [Roseibium sp. Sym1]